MKLGLKYDLSNYNCFNLLSDTLKDSIFKDAGKSLSNYKNLINHIEENYEKIDIAKYGDIAMFKKHDNNTIAHVGYMMDNVYCYHIEDDNLGSKIEPITKIKNNGLHVLYYRKKREVN